MSDIHQLGGPNIAFRGCLRRLTSFVVRHSGRTPRLARMGAVLSRPGGYVAACSFVLLSGCSNMHLEKAKSTPSRTEVVNESRLNPAQRRQRFAYVYAAGMDFARNHEYGRAMTAFDEAARLRPDSTEALFNLAACYEGIGDPLRAIGIYNKVLRLSPNDADCYQNLGTSYMKLYHLQNSPAWRRMAIKAWKRSLALRPDQPKIRTYIAKTVDARD